MDSAFKLSSIQCYNGLSMSQQPVCSPELSAAGVLSTQMQCVQIPTQTQQVMDAATHALACSHGIPAMYTPSPVLPGHLASLAITNAMQMAAKPLPSSPLMLPRTPADIQLQQAAQLHSTIFFAGANPIVGPETLLTLFSQFGRVMDLNLFRPFPGCRTSKGCGLVVFSTRQEAAATMEALHGKFVWPGARSAMVIEWCDPSKQHKKARAQPLAHNLLHQMVGWPSVRTIGVLPAAVPGMHTSYLPAAAAAYFMMQ